MATADHRAVHWWFDIITKLMAFYNIYIYICCDLIMYAYVGFEFDLILSNSHTLFSVGG